MQVSIPRHWLILVAVADSPRLCPRCSPDLGPLAPCALAVGRALYLYTCQACIVVSLTFGCTNNVPAAFKVWADAGIAVYGFDVHGMGLSEPSKASDRILVKKFDYLPEDAIHFLEEVLQVRP